MIFCETKVVPCASIHEGEPAGRRRVPGICVWASGLSHDGRGVPSPEFNDIKGLKGSPRRRWGSILPRDFDAELKALGGQGA